MEDVIKINGLKDLITGCSISAHYDTESIFFLNLETVDSMTTVKVKPTITSNGIEYLYKLDGKYLEFNDWLLELYKKRVKHYSEQIKLLKESEETARKALEILNNKLSKNRGDMIK